MFLVPGRRPVEADNLLTPEASQVSRSIDGIIELLNEDTWATRFKNGNGLVLKYESFI